MIRDYCQICGNKIKTEIFSVANFPLFIRAAALGRGLRDKRRPLKIGFCLKCGQLQQISPPSLRMIEKNYQNEYSYPSTFLTGIGRRLIDEFLCFLKKFLNKKAANVLEIGCFDGYLLYQLKNLGHKTTGCDPCSAVQIGIKKGLDIKKDFFRPELFPGAQFDLVIMRHLIEHIKNPKEFLSSVKTVMAPNGLLAIETPNYQFSLENNLWCDFHFEHFSLFTPDSLRFLLASCGFQTKGAKESQRLYFIAQKTDRPAGHIAEKSNLKLKTAALGFQKRTAEFIKTFKEKINRARKNKKTIAIFGAGGYTSALAVLAKLKKSDISYVVDSDKTKQGQFIIGFSSAMRISPVERLKKEPVGYIIPGSNWHQADIIATIKKMGVKSEIMKIY